MTTLGESRRAWMPQGRASAAASRIALVVGSLLALAGFAWPLIVPAVPAQAQAAAPWVAFALVPAVAVALALALDAQLASAKAVALLGVLGAIGAAVRIGGAGIGGVEPVFILLVLAGYAYGARFGFLLGLITITVSSVLWGGIGYWTPFQAFGCAWVAAGAGLIPRIRLGGRSGRSGRWLELGVLALYGAVAAYLFGALLNLWFWPFSIGLGTGVSYAPDAPLGHQLTSFALFTLASSTLTWDTVRAITTVAGILIVGAPVLAALRRAKLTR